ncbi:MAG: hypothetical protein ACE5GG_00520, partial [Candidatus Omnitrophota bacterium]
PNVKLEYSSDAAHTNWTTITSSTANDGTYSWTIPNDASTTVQARVSDVNDTDTADTSHERSANDFHIDGAFDVTAPDGGERWVVNEPKYITWNTTAGSAATIPKVKVEYSVDLQNLTWTTIKEAEEGTNDDGIITNDGTFLWTVPHPVSSQIPPTPSTTVKIRISDASDSDAYDASAQQWTIDYYWITWSIKDLLMNTSISAVTVYDDAGWYGSQATPYQYFGDGDVRGYPYQATQYTVILDKTPSYNLASASFSADQDQTVYVYMESTTVRENTVYSDFTYDANTDTLYVKSWLEQTGLLVPSPTSVTVEIHESPSGALAQTLTSSSPDSNGIFWQSWANTGMDAAKTYFAKTSIVFSSSTFTGGDSYDIYLGEVLKDTGTTLPATISTINTSVSNVETKVDSLTTKVDAVKTDTAAILTDTGTTLPGTLTKIKDDVAAILEDTGTDLPKQIQSNVVSALGKGVQAEILSRPTSVMTGTATTIRYRTDSGLAPTISVYDDSNTLQVSAATMSEIGTTGIYEYDLTLSKSWGMGDFTIICQEATKGSLDSMVLTVLSTDLETISDDIANVSTYARNANTQATNAYNALNKLAITVNSGRGVKQVSRDVASLRAAISGLSANIERLSSEVVGGGGAKEDLTANIKAALAELKGVAESKEAEKGQVKGEDMTILMNRMEEVKVLMEALQAILDKKSSEPVIKTWYEAG